MRRSFCLWLVFLMGACDWGNGETRSDAGSSLIVCNSVCEIQKAYQCFSQESLLEKAAMPELDCFYACILLQQALGQASCEQAFDQSFECYRDKIACDAQSCEQMAISCFEEFCDENQYSEPCTAYWL